MFVSRTLQLPVLLEKKSHFLFGPRGTGKTSLIRRQFPTTRVIDLLSDDTYSRLLRRPSLLGEMLEGIPAGGLVIIDEIQRIPTLLNEVHRIIEAQTLRFLLTGSSARKLKRGGVNLLGGRAWEARLCPLTSKELGKDFELIHYLNTGGVPSIYFSRHPRKELENYVLVYIKEEIQAEALVKRLDHFSRFLDTVALANLEEQNFESIGNDAGVPARTVAAYFELLEDTLMGFSLLSFERGSKRKAIKRSKFVFFDVGVAGTLAKRGRVLEGSELFGRALEHFIIQEVRSFLAYTERLDVDLAYWRTTTQYEVDLIVGNEAAIEIKATSRVSDMDLRGLKALSEEKLIRKYFLVSSDPISRNVDGIEIIPWNQFLKRLWDGAIVAAG